MTRFITGTRRIPTRTLGDLVRPIITDTEKGQTATFVPGTNVKQIAAHLNAGIHAPGRYTWRPVDEIGWLNRNPIIRTVIDDETRSRTRRIAAEDDARIAWTLPLSWVIDLVAHDIIPNGVPMSGDHRRFAEGSDDA